MRRLGCSAKILIPVVAVLLILFVFGFVIGPIGSSLFKIKPPDFLAISTPKVELPAETIVASPIYKTSTSVLAFNLTNTLIASWLTIIVLVVLFYFCTRKMKLIPGRWQGFAEMVVETLNNFVKGIAGDKNSRRLLPMIATIFLFIIGNAILALLPFFGTIGLKENGTIVPLFRAVNTDVNLPLALAIIAVFFIEYLGFKENGGLHYINGFFKFEVLGGGFKNLFKGKIKPALSGIFMGAINLFIGFIEVLSHIIRLVSFTFRLFGNMTAGEILLLVITFLLPFVTSIIFSSLELFFGFIQALIFASLTLVWSVIALTPHEEE